jgi:hypothetical protein
MCAKFTVGTRRDEMRVPCSHNQERCSALMDTDVGGRTMAMPAKDSLYTRAFAKYGEDFVGVP